MVIDDEWSIREVVSLMLERAGYSVKCAGTAEEGLKFLADAQPDALLLDVMMPGRNGIELALEIHQKWPVLPMVLMSGQVSTEADSIQNFIGRFGIKGSISKPFTNEQLLDVLGSIIKAE
jgi:CheY-like chemotaxis protein